MASPALSSLSSLPIDHKHTTNDELCGASSEAILTHCDLGISRSNDDCRLPDAQTPHPESGSIELRPVETKSQTELESYSTTSNLGERR